MDVAVEEDTVLVAPGTYSEAEERYVNLIGVPIPVTSLCFFANGVTLKSEAGPEGTVLDLQGQESSMGVRVGSL